MDRVARTTGFAVTSAGGGGGAGGTVPEAGPGTTVPGLRDLPDGDASLELTGQAIQHYDGPAFTGLPAGQVGAHGVPVRTETLVLTEAIAARAYGPDRPPYLAPAGAPAWGAEYPAAFRASMPARAGYTWHDGDAQTQRGWWVQTARRRFDVQAPGGPGGAGRGLIVATRPPLGTDAGERDTTIRYDALGLFPVSVTDPLGLSVTAEPDYRAWKTRSSTDPNGTVTRFAFTPYGELAASWITGRDGAGDQVEPGVTLHYDRRAFADRGEPTSVRSVRRVHADGDTGIPPDRRDEVVEKVQYADGFGRALQSRTRAPDTRFGDERTGDGLLDPGQAVHPGPISGRTRAAGDPVNVVVSGWVTYDAKGRPV